VRRAAGRPGLLLVLTLLVSLVHTASARAAEEKPCVRVMTWNLYVGADLTRAIQAKTPEALLEANAEVFRVLHQTDFHERARAIAAQIVKEDPDVVALQEAVLWLTGPLNDPAQATTVEYDFVRILQDELDSLGAPYQEAFVLEESDTEAPAGPPVSLDVRLVDRDAVLVREGFVDEQHGVAATFASQFSFPSGTGRTLTSTRGWIALDLTLAGTPIRFVNTHLEAFDWQVRLAQAKELLDPTGPIGGATTDVILLGDLNTGPDLPVPDNRKAFFALTDFGLVDTWAQLHPGDPGYTAGFTELLDQPSASVLEHRVDHVMSLGALTPVESRIVGIAPGDRTPSGMWPSDHAGLVASITL
jgi:endonuclease/exonuclease/phosphatase family metal-dependent hydrolase